jgi:hypothetical protein
MTDLANLEIQIRASGIEAVRRALGDLAAAADRAEKSVDSMVDEVEGIERGSRGAGRAVDRLGGELDATGKSARKAGQEGGRAADKIDELDTSSRRAADGTRQLDESAGQLGRTAGGLSGSLGGLSTILGTLGGAVSFGALVGTLTEFEDGLVGVSKTTGIGGDALAELEAGIESLATRSSASIADLFGIAQAAGQLGIQGGDSILKFTDAVAKLTDAAPSLRGSSEETALSLARILAVTGESTDSVTALASTVALLGDSFATVESSVLTTGLEVAKAGAAFGVSAQEALGLATAFDVIGTEAELSRSSVVQVFSAITKAVAEGGDKLTGFSASAGQTSEAFARLFQESPVAALEQFLAGLGQLDAAGAETTLILDGLGLSSVRLQPTLLTLANNSEILRDALAAAAAEFENPTKLAREFEAGSDRLGAALGRLGNTAKIAVDNFADDGTGFAGVLRVVVEQATDAVRVLGGLDEEVQGSRAAAGVAAGVFAGLGTAVGVYAAVAGTARVATLALNTTLLSTPVGAVAVAVGGLVGALVTLDATITQVNGKQVSLIDDLKVLGQAFLDAGNDAETLPGSVGSAMGGVARVVGAAVDGLIGLLLAPFEILQQNLDDLSELLDISVKVREGDLAGAFDSIKRLRDAFAGEDGDFDIGKAISRAVRSGADYGIGRSIAADIQAELEQTVFGISVAADRVRLARGAGGQATPGGDDGGAAPLPDIAPAGVAGLEELAARLAQLGQSSEPARGGLSALSNSVLGVGLAAAGAAPDLARLAQEQEELARSQDQARGAAEALLGALQGEVADFGLSGALLRDRDALAEFKAALSATGYSAEEAARQLAEFQGLLGQRASLEGFAASQEVLAGLALDLEDLDFALEQVLRTGPEARKAAALREIGAALKDAGVSGDQAAAVLGEFESKLDRLTDLERITSVARGFADALGQGLKDVVLDIENADEALRNLAGRLGEVALDRLVIEPFVQGVGDSLANAGADLTGEAVDAQAGVALQAAGAGLQGAGATLQAAGATQQAAGANLQTAALSLQAAAGQLSGGAGAAAGAAAGAGGAAGNAQGNAFGGGGVMAFASGGAFGGLRGRFGDVIRSQVAFPMGIAGEAGPEAIMPGRMAGGRFLVGAVQEGRRVDLPLGRDGSGDLVVDMGSRRFAEGGAFGPSSLNLPLVGGGVGSSSRESGSTINFNYNITTPDANSFRRSQSQIEADARKRVGDGSRRRS